MLSIHSLAAALPVAQPDDAGARLLLFGIRQIGANGLADAAAAHAFVSAFGRSFRRPLLLLRTLMGEISTHSAGPIPIAPWCCPRMTAAEATLVAAIARAPENPRGAAVLLADLLGVREAGGTATTAALLGQAFADAGLPLPEA